MNTVEVGVEMSSALKRLRERRALSLSDLSELTGISRVTINRVENRKQKPLPRTIRKLAKALNVEVEELTTEQGILSESSERHYR
jgi:XRE family transcriptional regulator, regulator of sulfur utilization